MCVWGGDKRNIMYIKLCGKTTRRDKLLVVYTKVNISLKYGENFIVYKVNERTVYSVYLFS